MAADRNDTVPSYDEDETTHDTIEPPAYPNDETTPLLAQNGGKFTTPAPVLSNSRWKLVVGTIILIVALTDIGGQMSEAPLVRVYEEIACAKYWGYKDPSHILPDGTIPEKDCKINDVQEVVALVVGWSSALDAIIGILLAVPLGMLADNWGRKPMLFLGLFGILLSSIWKAFACYMKWRLEAIWVSSIFQLMGGGAVVGSAMLLTMMADVMPAEKRTSIFLWVQASAVAGETLGPIFASWLMRSDPYVPVLIGVAIQASAFFCAIFLPETLQYRPTMPSILRAEPSDEEAPRESTGKAHQGLLAAIVDSVKHLKDSFSFVFKDRSLAIALFTFLCVGLNDNAMNLLLQYFPKRYGWSIADAALLGTLRSLVNLVVYLVILPTLPYILIKRYNLSSSNADLLLCKLSGVLLTIGMFMIGISPTVILAIVGLIIDTFGKGYAAFMRSIATSLLGGGESHNLARLYTMMQSMQGLGTVITGPLIPMAFAWGMNLGGVWIGMPFLFTTVGYAAMVVVTFFIEAPGAVSEEDEEHE